MRETREAGSRCKESLPSKKQTFYGRMKPKSTGNTMKARLSSQNSVRQKRSELYKDFGRATTDTGGLDGMILE